MTVKNSERFLAAFNRIDHTMRDIIGAKDYIPFSRLIDQAKKRNMLVKKYEDDLRNYAELRNAIVHNRTSVDYAIAEPHDEVVQTIEYIDAALAHPKLVGQLCQTRVMTFQVEDSLEHVLKVIRQYKYTQFPVYKGAAFQGLLTTVGLTNWLASSLTNMQLPKESPTLQDILMYEKSAVNYRFISRTMSIYEAQEIFKKSVEDGRRLEALLVTEHGKPTQKLLGIMTPIDAMKVD